MIGIEIIHERGVYTIYLDGDFWCTCENMAEVTEELISIEEENK